MANIGYIRVSTEDQNTARQLVGIQLDRVFEDKLSGKNTDRPELQKCLLYAREGDTLYIHSMDRLARNLIDLQSIVADLTDKGVTIKFGSENMTFTKDSNPMSILMLQMMGAFAEFERKLIKQRVKEGIANAKINGTKTGKPFGNAPMDPKIVAKAKELYDSGMTISQVARELKISRTPIYNMLNK
jgi:DNA invertase Pin-like site-specific DNA recombinase